MVGQNLLGWTMGSAAALTVGMLSRPSQRAGPTIQLKNLVPTPYDEICLASSAYDDGHKMDGTLHSKGFKICQSFVDHDTGLKVVMYAIHWFPEPQAASIFPYHGLVDDDVTVGFVFRGTDPNLLGNVKADLQLVLSKFTNGSSLPLITDKAYCLVASWMAELNDINALLHAHGKRLRVHVTGHSLGGFLAEVMTVLFSQQAALQNQAWTCRTFDSPGLPPTYVQQALSISPPDHWKSIMTSYLAAPNPINMLYKHIGTIYHVMVPFPKTVNHAVKCVVADVARVTAWVMALNVVMGSTAAAQATSVGGKIRSAALGGLTWASAGGVVKQLALALGVEVWELVDQHQLIHMFPCFQRRAPGELLGEYCRPMKAWPEYGELLQALDESLKMVGKWLLPSFVCQDNLGFANLHDRQGMIMRRCLKIPGYVPCDMIAPEPSPNPAYQLVLESDAQVSDQQNGQQGGQQSGQLSGQQSGQRRGQQPTAEVVAVAPAMV